MKLRSLPIAARISRDSSLSKARGCLPFTGEWDFTAPRLNELDEATRELNISRQAVIKTLLRHALDQQRLARRAG